MQWIYLICFILLSAGLLALFGVKPGDFIDAFFRSQRKSATLSDELNVLLGTPAKGFFNQDYELKQILKGTGRADRYEAIKRLSLILFAVGAVLALLIGNVYMVPILGIGFSLIPIWYLRSTAASYKKHLNEELETAISIITTSYLRTEDLIRSVKENLPYINEPVKANFEAFVYVRLLESVCDQWELTGFHRATYEYHAEKLRKIADKLQAGIGYDYDKAVERCKKKRARKSHSNDVGEDALLLTVRAAGKSADNEKEAAPYEEDTPWEPELE